ncbi:hypothetical protein ONS96_003825 [Cadophora gregata f. sp. sojae]|nr:hypothetical protein ONS96_003825 [Cadophora gregata f. sp. sojae]
MAFIEYRVNTPVIESLPTSLSQLFTPSGRRIKCRAIPQSKYEGGRSIQSFSLNNLDVNADSVWVQNTIIIAGCPVPKKIKIRESNRDGSVVTGDLLVGIVEATLKSLGSLESFHVGESVDGARMIVSATFCNRQDALKAVKIFRSKTDRPAGFDFKKLTIDPVASMKVNIPNKIASALEPQLQAMRVELQKRDKDMLKINKGAGKSSWVIRFSAAGDDALAIVAKTKARIEKLLAGTVVTDRGVALWHPWFATAADAGHYLNWLSLHNNVHVHRSINLGHLVIYGGTNGDRSRAWMMLKAKVQDLNYETAFTIRMFGGMTITQALVILKPVFGDKIRLSTTDGPKIKLCSSAADLRKASQSKFLTPCIHILTLSQARLLLNPGIQPAGKSCVICWSPPLSSQDTVSLPCGHIYCRECFNLQFNPQDQSYFPLTCAGACPDNSEYKYLFDINLLREQLSADKFESVLNMCLDMHVRSHSDELSYCPTTDCPTIYRPIPRSQQATTQDQNTSSITCTTCLHSICTSCRAIHTDLTCREYIDATDGQDALNAYKADAANQTKECPSCRVPVEKLQGTCNHMLCVSCGVHFCWVCGHVSPDMAGAYKHLDEVHGGNGLQDVAVWDVPDPGIDEFEGNWMIDFDFFDVDRLRVQN